jgi:hypothetical protein
MPPKLINKHGLDADWLLFQIRSVSIQELKSKVSGDGFRPFAIRTTDGQEFEIPHPEFILIGKQSLAVLDKRGFIKNIDPLHIVSARDLSRRNGGA